MRKEDNTLENRIAQFKADQVKPATPAAPKKKSVAATDKGNPYLRARLQILDEWNTKTDRAGQSQAWKAREIAEMEKTGDINNKPYDEFVRKVRERGDELSA